jgi:hypothetical protein
MTQEQLYKMESMSYIDIDTKDCLGIVAIIKGQIVDHSCPITLAYNETIDIDIICKNIGTVSGTFRLLFCTSSHPTTDCGINPPILAEFVLDPDTTRNITTSLTMPNSIISYNTILEHMDPGNGENWIIDDIVSCDISLTSPPVAEAGGSPILTLGLAVGIFMMIISKRKEKTKMPT